MCSQQPNKERLDRIAIISVHGCPIARLGERDTGGMNVYVLQTAIELGRQGLKVDVFTRVHDPKDEQITELGPNARVIHLKAGAYHENKNDLHQHIPLFISLLQEFKESNNLRYQLVHTHYWLSGLVGNILSEIWEIPMVSNFHTLGELKLKARVGETEPEKRLTAERHIMANADLLIATTRHERDAMNYIYNIEPRNVAVIPCGVDTHLFRPLNVEECKKRLGLQNNQVILFVGRIEPLKGLDLLLQAVAQVENQGNLRLVIVGGRTENYGEISRLQDLANTLGIKSITQFKGTVPQDQLPVYYNAADICLLPSYYESFGLVALEAQACATPVIASRVGGLPTIVQDNETGYLIAGHCPEPFAEHIEMLLQSQSLRYAMGQAGRRHALELSWEHVATSLGKAYYQLLS
jgi:D-inositol-3-phosphate glycosyltransferase